MEGLRAYLLQKGIEPEAANRQVLRLTRADTSVFPSRRADTHDEGPDLTPAGWQPSAPSGPAALSSPLEPTERASSSGEEVILVPPRQEPSMIERLRSVGSQDAAVLATVDLSEPSKVEADGDSDFSLSETEVKEAIAKHVEP